MDSGMNERTISVMASNIGLFPMIPMSTPEASAVNAIVSASVAWAFTRSLCSF